LNNPVVRPPWTINLPAGVRAAKPASKWSGFRSPVIVAKRSTSSDVNVLVHVPRLPTAGGVQPMEG
jgi:hypothetical protein